MRHAIAVKIQPNSPYPRIATTPKINPPPRNCCASEPRVAPNRNPRSRNGTTKIATMTM
jgi:hypothetical protein